jgi:hypothetical protein
MPRVGFESTTPVFEWAKTVYVLDRSATLIGTRNVYWPHSLLRVRQVASAAAQLETRL